MTPSFVLAIDVGTSRTSAATAWGVADGDTVAAPFPLGRNTDNAPSAVYVGDGEMLFGDAAERRGIVHPERLIHEYKRRIGDPVPIVAGDQRFAPEELYARTVTWVIERVVEREGHQPARICVTVPVTWGPHRLDLVRSAIEREGWSDVELISEPEAAARHYESTRPLDPGRCLAVYDLGGGTFDAVILRKSADGRIEIVGTPVGIADLGGADFDDAVFRHAVRTAGISLASATSDDLVPLAALRRECVDAKESLSFDSEAVIPVMLGERRATVRLTRSEFESMIEESIDRTTDLLADAVATAKIDVEDIAAILLTGGSSRIPRIAQLLSERFDRPVAIDADPKAIIALGAARAVAVGTSSWAMPLLERVPAQRADDVLVAAGAGTAASSAGALAAPAAALAAPQASAAPRSSWFRRTSTVAVVAGGALVLATGIVFSTSSALSGGAPTSEPDAAGGSFLAALGIALGDEPANAAEPGPSTPPSAVPEKIANPEPKTTNPRTRSMEKADSVSEAAAPSPSPRIPNSPVSTPVGPVASNPDTPTGTGPAPEPTYEPPPPSPEPEPEPTTVPDPEPEPEPEPTTAPEPEPTTDPGPGSDPPPADPAPVPASTDPTPPPPADAPPIE